MTDAAADAPAPRRAGLVAGIDRWFALVWIGLYALLPVSGAGERALETANDQSRDLEALRSVLAERHADAIADNLIGPGYIATAAVIHWVGRLSPEDSLITLTRLSYVLAVAICLVLVRVTVRRLVPGETPVALSLSAQVAFTALVVAAGTWYWSDVPWSHFYATLLAVGLYALRFGPARGSTLTFALAGAVLGMLAVARTFEFIAVVAAWALVLVVLATLRLRPPGRVPARRLALGAGSFLVVIAAVHVVTGKRGVFVQYSSDVSELYGSLRPEEVATMPSLDLSHVHLKVVQVFLDPCFYSLCSLSEYAGIRAAWRQPLSIQLPALLLIPFCVVAVGLLVIRAARRRQNVTPQPRELQLLGEMTVMACGLVFGYLASPWASSTALRYGFARDFMLPALLAAMVAVCVSMTWLYGAVLRWGTLRVPGTRRLLSPGGACVAATALGAIVLAVGVVVTRTYGLPRIDSRHLATLEYTATCAPERCTVDIVATNEAGASVVVPRTSLLTFGCGSSEPSFTFYVKDPAEGVAIPSSCADPQLVSAWPTIMGDPPNSNVLRVVAVANA